MICPTCRSEFVDGIDVCSDCEVPLVEDLGATPKPEAHVEAGNAVIVLTTGRGDIVAIAKSLLMSEAIDFTVEGEDVQDLFGYGRFTPTAGNLITGPIRIFVAEEDGDRAKELLSGLTQAPGDAAVVELLEPADPSDFGELPEGEGDYCESEPWMTSKRADRLMRAFIWAALALAAVQVALMLLDRFATGVSGL